MLSEHAQVKWNRRTASLRAARRGPHGPSFGCYVVLVSTTSPALPPALKSIADSVVEEELPNGLKVRLLPSSAVPTCSYYTFFRVGSRNERPGITGISHLFEHMMFNGARRHGPGAFDTLLESSGGASNAYTSNDLTVYHEDFMAEALPTVVDLESDRMESLLVTPQMLESEREVVKEERRFRVDNEVSGLLDEELSSLMWKAHPYRWPVIGWMRDIESISREDCLQYFRTFYAPNNATIFLSGDFEVPEALRLIRQAYGHIPRGPPVPGVLNAEPAQKGERRAKVRHPAQGPSMMVAWHGPSALEPDTLALDVLQYALGVGQSSRLIRKLVFETERAVSVQVDWTWRVDPGAFVVALELQPGGDVAAAEATLQQEIDRVCQEPLTTREVEKARNNLSSHLLRELATNHGRAHALGTYEMMLGDWREGLRLAERYEAISAEDVLAAARRHLRPEGRAVVVLEPTAAEVA
jgi:zinc protease